jgi:hypothetical protein
MRETFFYGDEKVRPAANGHLARVGKTREGANEISFSGVLERRHNVSLTAYG